jgi:hypothetical protein
VDRVRKHWPNFLAAGQGLHKLCIAKPSYPKFSTFGPFPTSGSESPEPHVGHNTRLLRGDGHKAMPISRLILVRADNLGAVVHAARKGTLRIGKADWDEVSHGIQEA